jgi:hypothetical protein
MLSSSTSRFYWAKQGRRSEESLFRLLARGWRRPIRNRAETHIKTWHRFHGWRGQGRTQSPAVKVKWSPWQWVD